LFRARVVFSGLLLLATGIRRWKGFGAQWPINLSGAQSAFDGPYFSERLLKVLTECRRCCALRRVWRNLYVSLTGLRGYFPVMATEGHEQRIFKSFDRTLRMLRFGILIGCKHLICERSI